MTPYRLPSILEVFQKDQLAIKRVHDLLEELAKNARCSLAKFVATVDGDPNRLQVVGTGFWAALDQTPFLVSAHHVIKDFNLTSGGGVVAGDLSWSIARSAVMSDPVQDIAWVQPSRVEDKDGQDLAKMPALGIFKSSELIRWHPTSTLLTIGFPAQLNLLDKRKPKSTIEHYFQYFCHGFEVDEAADEIRYVFESKKCFSLNPDGRPLKDLPNPEGLSGSPVMMVMYGESEVSMTLALRVVGVAIEWQQIERKLVVRRIGDPLV